MHSDLRYVMRSLCRARSFTLVTILTLALGIGSAAAIFSVVDWILFRPDGFPTDVYLVGLGDKKSAQPSAMLWDVYLSAYRAQTNVFTEYGLSGYQVANVAIGGDPVQSSVVGVSPNFLPMMGIIPALGRGFLPGEDVEGRNDVVVISNHFSEQHFGGAEGALGRKITVGGRVCVVVGVLKPGQQLPPYCYSEVFRPLAYRPNPKTPWDPYLVVFGRLRPGVTPHQAEAALAGAKVDLPAPYSSYGTDKTPMLSTLAQLKKLNRPEIYWMLVGAVGFLYGIACLNATNLMLVRMLGMKREVSIRLALGGGRWRIIRLFLFESCTLSLAACVAGVFIANWLVPLFSVLAGTNAENASWTTWSLHWRAIVVLGATTVLTAGAIAVVPSIRVLRADIQAGLKDGGAAVGESVRLARVRGLFVILQAAFAVILLTGAGLMVRTFQKLQDVNLGFDTSQRVRVRLSFPSGYVEGNEERLALLERLQERLLRVPGVSSAVFGSDSLMAGWEGGGMEILRADGTTINVAPDFFPSDFRETSGLVLKRGRWLRTSEKVEVVINESLAKARFGREDPIGQIVKLKGMPLKGPAGWLVVGVVADVRETVRTAPGNTIYCPGTWSPAAMTTFIVLMRGKPGREVEGVFRRAIYQFDPKIVTSQVDVMDDMRDKQLYFERFATAVLKVLSAIATVLTVIGFFSVLAYTVDQRMREFGVRMALGASPRNLAALVLRRALLLAGLGVATGVAGALALARYLQSLLYETPAYDPAVLALVVAALMVAASASCVLPAARAARVGVADLLRAE